MAAVPFSLFLVTVCSIVYGQNVNNVRLVDHREYMTEVLTQVGHILEERQWCNLKIPEFEIEVDQVILNWNVTGKVSFLNGFAISIQRLEILESSLNQIWSWNNDNDTGMVEVRGTLRMHDLTIGFDVVADFGGIFRSTATYLHPLISFDFSIFRNTQTLATVVTVAGTHPRSLNKLNFLPTNNATDVITALYDSNITFTGITAWSEGFQTIALDVVTNRVSFPVICYDCPVT